MTKRIQKNEIAERVASRLSIDDKVSEEYLYAVFETLYAAFKWERCDTKEFWQLLFRHETVKGPRIPSSIQAKS